MNPVRSICIPYFPMRTGSSTKLSAGMPTGNRFSPYEKCHSTVRDACLLAEKLAVRNLVLWHTEDSDLPAAGRRIWREGSLCFSGNLYVPEDGEIISLAGTEMA